ncbi:hypothetical protein MFLAVUS_008976 [Mucor flavus]|uniref:Uncharacterized protein n=1 Tax=Mucor flavus TaxID=439312 RepID=A0ABP9Z8P2_9FUNG
MTTLTSSTEVAVQFLEHVLRIPYFRIDCIRVENLEQILMEFYDQKHMIKKLYINSRRHIETCYLSIADNLQCIDTDMGFHFDDVKLLVNQEDNGSISSILSQLSRLEKYLYQTYFVTYAWY